MITSKNLVHHEFIGLKVHVTGKKAYDQFRLEDVRPDSIPYETDNAFGEAIKDALTGGGSMKSAVKNTTFPIGKRSPVNSAEQMQQEKIVKLAEQYAKENNIPFVAE